MGVFSINESHFNLGPLPEVEMNEDYTTGSDLALALVEARENEFAVLNAGIKQDVIAAMCEDWDERIAINEATASGVLNKVKEILKKLLEKLKSIFHAFIAKMESFFKDSYEFYKKYVAEIAKKNLTEFKIKCREFHVDKMERVIKTGDNVGVMDKWNNPDTNKSSGLVEKLGTLKYWIDKVTDDDYNTMMESDELGKFAIGAVFDDDIKNNIDEDLNNIASEIEEYLFEDAEERDDIGNQIITADWIGGLLSKKKFISDIKKVNDSIETQLKKLITQLNKDIAKFAETSGTDKTYTGRHYTLNLSPDTQNKSNLSIQDDPDDKKKTGYNVHAAYKDNNSTDVDATTAEEKKAIIRFATYRQAQASKYQEAMTKANNARLSCAKKAVAQAKKIFAAAVAYNPKKENYELYTAVGESAEFEAIMAME